MVYKIGNVADLDILPLIDDTALELLLHYARVLTIEYRENRNIDEDDGGYLLYAAPDTNAEEIKAYFDYTKHTPEYVDKYGSICVAMYIIHNEYAVVIVMSIADAPEEITKEFVEGY